MARMAKHLVLLGLSMPAALAGYHLALAQGGPEAEFASRRLVDAVGVFSLDDQHRLADLDLLRRCFYYVEQRYVEKDRLDPEQMFQGALDLVERRVNEVLFVREPGGRRLHVSVGAHTASLTLGPLEDFETLTTELGRVAVILDQHLSPDVDKHDVEYALVNGALSVLDPHSLLLPPEAARDMEVDNQGEFGGLGIEITTRGGTLTVTNSTEGTPAYEAGLKAGDKIVRIEDESTINMDLSDAVERLRGAVGTPVNLLVERKQLPAPKPFTIVRDTIRVNYVEGLLLEGDVGYLRIKQFHKHVSSDLDEQLARLRRESARGLQGLVLDLRGNPGGYLNQAYEVSNKFLSEGVIVSTVEGDSRRRDEQRATRPGTEPDYPIAVLVDGSSASASEIVAGALRNQQRAVIIGEQTFGKGSVQHLYDNRDATKLKLTVAKYLTPGDHSIQGVGIPPDILLKPTTAQTRPDGTPRVSLYAREWTDREASLDHHLGSDRTEQSDAVFTVRYLAPDDDDASEDARRDWQVGFAREVLLTARTPRRADLLRAAAPAVYRRAEAEEDRIEAALARHGFDWTEAGAPASALDLSVQLDLGDDGALVAGVPEDIAFEVTNNGPDPVYRLSGVTRSDNPWLNHLELVFGRINPGETARYVQKVSLHDGYSSELSPVHIDLRGPDEAVVRSVTRAVPTRGQALPRLEYKLSLRDDGTLGSEGNGDGLPEVGERVAIEVMVRNIGEGSTRGGFARVKNEAGRALDLVQGTVELGERVDADGAPCEEEGDATDCVRALAPGAAHVGAVTFDLRDRYRDEDGGWALELRVGDNERYDYAAVQQGGFYDYFQLTETLVLRPDAPLDGSWRTPPHIAVSRAPDLESTAPEVVLSGLISADAGVRDVLVFHDDEKIFYRGGSGATAAVPFTADAALSPGSNLFLVLARDDRGLSSTWSRHVHYEGAATTAQVTEPFPR